MEIVSHFSSLIQFTSYYGNMQEVMRFYQSIKHCALFLYITGKELNKKSRYKTNCDSEPSIPIILQCWQRLCQYGIYFLPISHDIYLLLAECEVHTASYGPSFFLPFMAQARSARAMKTRKEKTRIHNLPYGPSKRG